MEHRPLATSNFLFVHDSQCVDENSSKKTFSDDPAVLVIAILSIEYTGNWPEKVSTMERTKLLFLSNIA
jgi:hypothetical protein